MTLSGEPLRPRSVDQAFGGLAIFAPSGYTRAMLGCRQWGARLQVGLMALGVVASCKPGRPPAPPQVDLPPFAGYETDRWLLEESGPVGRDDVLPAFEASARDYGCRTERLGEATSGTIAGERRAYYGVAASCYEGTISVITLEGGNVLIGCAKPTTQSACNQLLRDIAESP